VPAFPSGQQGHRADFSSQSDVEGVDKPRVLDLGIRFTHIFCWHQNPAPAGMVQDLSASLLLKITKGSITNVTITFVLDNFVHTRCSMVSPGVYK